jgi:hydroxyethylthiazole kinase-like uncharacterized protein yjeF
VESVEKAAMRVQAPTIFAPAADAHKYRRGLCAIIGGSMPGATMLSAEAAMRSGAGYVKLMTDADGLPPAPASLVMRRGNLNEELSDSRIDAILVGPGLGRDDDAQSRLTAALQTGKPCLLDADALVLLTPDLLPDAGAYLATPHDGELEALCRSFSVVASSRLGKAQALAKTSGMTIIAKGPDTIIASPDGKLALGRPASSWLSVAGTGDVLAGIATARMATGLDPFEAACQAVWLHGKAASQCSAGFTADDLARMTSAALQQAVQRTAAS